LGPNPDQSEKPDPDSHQSKKIRELWRHKIESWRVAEAHNVVEEAQNGAMEAQKWSGGGSKMEPHSVCRQMVADSHHFDEKQDPDPDPDRIKVRVGFR
jgi:hypothetical protein